MLYRIERLEHAALLLLLLLILTLTPSTLTRIGAGAHCAVDIDHANAPLRECSANQPCAYSSSLKEGD